MAYRLVQEVLERVAEHSSTAHINIDFCVCATELWLEVEVRFDREVEAYNPWEELQTGEGLSELKDVLPAYHGTLQVDMEGRQRIIVTAQIPLTALTEGRKSSDGQYSCTLSG